MIINRWVYVLIIILTIPLGLATRKYKGDLPLVIGEYGGDTLWAFLMYWLLAFVFPSADRWKVVVASLIFSFCVEVSQLYHAEWIDYIRSTVLGKLVLGQGFLWSDFGCYTVGIVAALLLDRLMSRALWPR